MEMGGLGYVVVALIVLAITYFFVSWFRVTAEELGASITGVWQNTDRTMRVLIYEMDSMFRGEIVWTSPEHARMLGAKIFHSIELKRFKLGNGVYNCPFRQQVFHFQLRLVKSETMSLHLHTSEGKWVTQEHWTMVK